MVLRTKPAVTFRIGIGNTILRYLLQDPACNLFGLRHWAGMPEGFRIFGRKRSPFFPNNQMQFINLLISNPGQRGFNAVRQRANFVFRHSNH